MDIRHSIPSGDTPLTAEDRDRIFATFENLHHLRYYVFLYRHREGYREFLACSQDSQWVLPSAEIDLYQAHSPREACSQVVREYFGLRVLFQNEPETCQIGRQGDFYFVGSAEVSEDFRPQCGQWFREEQLTEKFSSVITRYLSGEKGKIFTDGEHSSARIV